MDRAEYLFSRSLFGEQPMLTHMLDLELQKKIQSKEFEHSVDQAVQSFLYDLDFMLLEEQHSLTRTRRPLVKPYVPQELLIPAA